MKTAATTNSSTSNKTSRTNAGDPRLRDGGEQETFGLRNQKKSTSALIKDKTKVPLEAHEPITDALRAPSQNFGKDEYVVDLAGHESRYWQDTESGLLGAFEFKGACTSGDGSCDIGSRSMGADFCNFNHG